MRLSRAVIFGLGLALSACANDKGIRVLSSGDRGPDEFAVLPSKPLSAPENYNALPTPTPGGSNLTDTNPLAEGAAVLGGSRTEAQSGSAFPSADSALVSYASRRGTPADIRDLLASDDAVIRGRFDRFVALRLSGADRYNEVYSRYHLNAYRELARWRAAGVATPTAPAPAN